MEIIVKGKNMEVTPALKGYVEKKLAKLDKFFENDNVKAQVSMGVERDIHCVDITLVVDGLMLRGEERTSDMYASVDGAIENIERQIRKYKTKINRKLREGGNMLVDAMFDNVAFVEAEEPLVVKSKRFAIKPMPVEEAIMQIELLGHALFVFMNANTEEVNVVYKRKNGNYGLIEPEF